MRFEANKKKNQEKNTHIGWGKGQSISIISIVYRSKMKYNHALIMFARCLIQTR